MQTGAVQFPPLYLVDQGFEKSRNLAVSDHAFPLPFDGSGELPGLRHVLGERGVKGGILRPDGSV